MKTRHILALIVSAFCLSFAIMSAALYVKEYIYYVFASQNDPYGYGDLTLLFIKLTANFIWFIGIVNSALGAILPLFRDKKIRKRRECGKHITLRRQPCYFDLSCCLQIFCV